jgi:hypothetical protein
MRPRISRAWTSDRGGQPRVIAAQKFFSQYACTPLPDTRTQLPENTCLSTTVDISGHSQGSGKIEFLKIPLFLHKANSRSLPSSAIRPKISPHAASDCNPAGMQFSKLRRVEALADKSQSMSCPQPIHNFRIQTISGTVLKKILGFACIRQSAVPLLQQLNLPGLGGAGGESERRPSLVDIKNTREISTAARRLLPLVSLVAAPSGARRNRAGGSR